MTSPEIFDPEAKEQELLAEATSWDISNPADPEPGGIPIVTLLLQDSPGLVIHSAKHRQWIKPPQIENAFVVNSGELLKQGSNDRFLSTRHFANNAAAGQSRYSIPFFFNATADYPMACLPSCHDEQNPPKYPTISYLESQAVVQGE